MRRNCAKSLVVAVVLTSSLMNTSAILAKVYENGSAPNGGAKYVNTGETFNVEENSTFTHNTSTAQNYGGGAIYNNGGIVDIGSGTSFVENYLNQPVTSSDDGNYRSAGGAIASWNGGSVTIHDNVLFENNGYNSITGNPAFSSGGAIYVDTNGTNLSQLTIGEGTVFKGNVAGSLGGAIYAGDSNTQITSTTFDGNKSGSWGGAIFAGQYYAINNNKVVIDGTSVFKNNEAGKYGGAIAGQYTTINIGDGTNTVSFDNNKAGIDGGAIHITTDADPSYNASSAIKSAVFTNNSAQTGSGGAIYNPADMTLENVAFGEIIRDTNNNIIGAQNGNTAAQNGGAIFNNAGGNITFSGDNNIFAGNTANQGGAVSNYGEGSIINFGDNAVFAYNTANSVGGAISTVDTGSGKTIIGNDALFIGNQSIGGQGGAVHNQRANTEIGDNAKFYNNTAIGYGGGAIYQDTDGALSSVTIGENAEFIGNSTNSSHGGAIMNFNASNGATVTIKDGATFENNTAAKTGGAISNWGAQTEIGKDSAFIGNEAKGSGGAIYNTIYGGSDADLTIKGNTSFTGNIAGTDGGAIYNAGGMTLDTTDGNISFSENNANNIANDIYAAANSDTNINGANNVSIGSGLISEYNSAISINDSAKFVIEEGAAAQIGGTLSTTTDTSSIVNNGQITIQDTGEASGNLTNNGDLVVEGSCIADVIQESTDASITVKDGGSLKTDSTLKSGYLTVEQGGKIIDAINVTDSVVVNVGSAIFDSTGLQVGGDPTNGHITGYFNLANTEVTFTGAFTQDLILSGTSQITTPEDVVKIGDGASNNTLTLSNGSTNAAGGKGFYVTSPATLKLSPDKGNSMTLDEKVSGNGQVLVDQKMIDNPNFDSNQPVSPDNPEKIGAGVGNINITSDNSTFTGNFLQKMGTVIAEAGSKFFGGSNSVEGGTLVLKEGADLTTEVNATANANPAEGYDEYGSVHIYNAIESTIGDDGISRITQDVLENGEIKYINSDGNTVDINITGGGLGLFNGTRVEGDTLTLNKDAGVRDLTFGNGSGSEADSIILNEATKLTYADNAYIKDDTTVSIGKNASLNFANTGNVTYNPVISSTSDTASINQIGSGSTVITSTLENYNGAVKVNGGSLDLASAEDKFLSGVSVSNGALHIAGNLAVENQAASDGKITVTNGSLSVDKAIETNDSLTITDANLSVGDYLAVGADATLTNSIANVVNDFATMGDVTIDNTKLTVGGESDLENVTIKGDNSNVTLGKDALMTGLTMTDKSSLNALGNINVTGDMTIGAAGSASSPSINMQSGAINTITADNIIINSAANILFDVDPRSQTTDRIISNNTIGGSENLLIGGINFTTSPIDRNVTFDISNLLTDPNGGNPDRVKLPDGGVVANSAMGQYMITSSGAGNPILNASLLSLNPQLYRGQVATLASWQNQLVVNNMLFDHMNVLTRQLMDDAKTANLRAAAYPQFAPYQYSVKDGSLWYKAYGNFERLSMTKGLSVGNNAYGSLVGADFPQISLKNGWNIIPTAYIAYNGAHQTFNGVSMYQNGAQIGLMGTAYKGDFITSLLAYGGGYGNDMSVRGGYGSGSDTTGNWFAGVASKTAYNFHLPHDFIFQPTIMAAYNAFGQQNWSSNFGAMSMSSGMLNGINVAPGFNLIWQKKTFSIYATAQMVYNVMGGVDGKAGNIDLGYVRMRHSYFEYGLGVMKKFKDTFNGYFQITLRNGGRTGIGFQGGLQWKIGKE